MSGAHQHLLYAPIGHPHGRVAFLSASNPLRLRAFKPEIDLASRSHLARLLRLRRRKLQISQEIAAVELGVSSATLRNWEQGRSPHVASYPKIIEFLGIDPWPEPKTLPQKLQAERYRRGLNVAQAAAVLDVDPSTMWWWEAGRRPHLLDHRRRIAAFLATEGAGTHDAQVAAPGSDDEAKVQTLGEVLRLRRRSLGLTLERVALSLGVNLWTLMNWEHDRRIPTDRYYPALIEFLGREPWPAPATLAESLRASRQRRGLSQEQAAAVMQVSPDSISDWESGRVPRHHLSLAKIEAFLSGAARPRRRSQRGRRQQR